MRAMTREPQTVVGVLLAGGRSSRMGGGDKCLRLLGGRPILARVIARAKPQVGPLVLNANGDVPFFPDDVVERLIAARNVQQADLAYAESGGRTHPVFGLWPVGLADALHRDLAQGGARKVEAWMAGHRVATAAYPTKPFDPFLNINRPEDEAVVERLIAEGVVPA